MRKKYLATKKRASEKGLDFNISFSYFQQLKLDDCHYCGTTNLLLAHYCEVMGLRTPWMTLDRTDNAKGYIPGNLVPACFVCNRIKSNFFTYEEMLDIGKKYVYPKMKKFERDAFDNFAFCCEAEVLDD